jgi:hypothetical protein
MKAIRCLVEQMNEELDDARKYVHGALRYKGSNKSLSEVYLTLGKEELNHFVRLHDQASQIIEEARQEGKQPPASMMELYNYEHDKAMDNYAEIKVLIDSAKNS